MPSLNSPALSASPTTAPRPPSLADLYTDNVSGGLTSVFQAWDTAFQLYVDNTKIASAVSATPPLMGGPLMTPSQIDAKKASAIGASDRVLGWARLWFPKDDGSRSSFVALNTSVSASGWPIAILYDRTNPNGVVTIQWKLGKDHLEYLKIPKNRVNTPGLDDPHLRVWLLPASQDTLYDVVVRNRGFRSSLVTSPTGATVAGNWVYTTWLEDKAGKNIPIHSIYAELI
jgi:hypothetical protein